MTTFERIQRSMPSLLDDLAAAPAPDYLDAVLEVTAATSQRASWTFLERWVPMSAVAYRAAVGPPAPVRLLALAGVLVLALLAALLIAGSQRPDPPNVFGPGRTGLVAYESGGDIYAGDAMTGQTTPLVVGPDVDRLPTWSLDGERLAFIRLVEVGEGALFVVGADGGAATPVRPDAFDLVTGLAWGPGGRSILVSWIRGYDPVVSIVDVATGATTDIPFAGSVRLPSFRPPDGGEIAFVGGGVRSSRGQGIYAYDVASRSVRVIVDPVPFWTIDGPPSWSPDGSRIAYATSTLGTEPKVFTVPAEGGSREPVPAPESASGQFVPVWAHDGRRLALGRWYGDRLVVAVVDALDGGPGTEVTVPTGGHFELAWSPGDERLLLRPRLSDDGQAFDQILIDPATGSIVPLAWTSDSDPAWQRQAP